METPELLTGKVSQRKELALLEKQSLSQQEWCSKIISSHPYTRLLRITAFIRRFVGNCSQKTCTQGPLTSEEIQQAERVWIRLAQSTINSDNDFQLKKDNAGIFRCYGRVSYYHPIFIPKDHLLAKRIVEVYHKATLHGGIQATMSKVRERFWIPRLQKLVKSIKYKSGRCK